MNTSVHIVKGFEVFRAWFIKSDSHLWNLSKMPSHGKISLALKSALKLNKNWISRGIIFENIVKYKKLRIELLKNTLWSAMKHEKTLAMEHWKSTMSHKARQKKPIYNLKKWPYNILHLLTIPEHFLSTLESQLLVESCEKPFFNNYNF